MNLPKLVLLSIISFSIASVSSAASLATKVEPAVTVPGENSSAKRIRILTTVKDSKGNDVMDGFGDTVKCYTWVKA
ncbi:hypothetical protein N9P22_00840 [Amylibacter sp.]|nr:hypothetical protein [Amylibacter sp.]